MKHLHHKVPKHMGGSDDPSNLVEVTVEQHAELHLALYLEYGRWQDWIAFNALAGTIGKEEIVSLICSNAGSKLHTDETKQKISKARKGIKFSEEHKKKLSKARMGKKPWNAGISWTRGKGATQYQQSEEFRANQAEGSKGNCNRGKPVVFMGVKYPSIKAAADAHGHDRRWVERRLKKGT